jgi:hypothetical protein
MLARPFLGLSRSALRLLLILLVAAEIALGADLYTSVSKASNTAAPVPSPTATPVDRCTTVHIHNAPKTVVVGYKETFSVCLPTLAGLTLRYLLTYPDHTSQSISVVADKTGYSKQAFTINYRPQGARDTIKVSVLHKGLVQQSTRFAIQVPGAQLH